MGYDHMRLVAQNAPYVTRGGPITRLDLSILYLIAWHVNDDGTHSRFIPLATLKHELRIRPEVFDSNIQTPIDRLMDVGLIEVKAGRGKKASTYTLTRKIMLPGLPGKNGESPPPAETQPKKAKKVKAPPPRAEVVKSAPAKKPKAKKKIKYQARWQKEKKAEKAAAAEAYECPCQRMNHETPEAHARIGQALNREIFKSELTDEENDEVTILRTAPDPAGLAEGRRREGARKQADEGRRRRDAFGDHMSP